MSVSMTLEAVRAEIKTVTRRHENTWANLQVGDHLVLIEKGMGLAKGATQVVVTEVVVTAVDVIPLWPITWPEVCAEGLADEARQADPWRCSRCGSWRWVSASLTGPVSHGGRAIRQCTPCGHYSGDDATHEPALRWFCRFWLKGHGYPADMDPATVKCRRIEWRYLP